MIRHWMEASPRTPKPGLEQPTRSALSTCVNTTNRAADQISSDSSSAAATPPPRDGGELAAEPGHRHGPVGGGGGRLRREVGVGPRPAGRPGVAEGVRHNLRYVLDIIQQ